MASENYHVADGKEILDAFFGEQNKPLTIPELIDHEESIADIAAILRRYVLPSLADRLMAAWKRDRESLLTKQGGNAAAMREALVVIRDALADRESDGLTEPRDILERHIVDAALASQPLNCNRRSRSM